MHRPTLLDMYLIGACPSRMRNDGETFGAFQPPVCLVLGGNTHTEELCPRRAPRPRPRWHPSNGGGGAQNRRRCRTTPSASLRSPWKRTSPTRRCTARGRRLRALLEACRRERPRTGSVDECRRRSMRRGPGYDNPAKSSGIGCLIHPPTTAADVHAPLASGRRRVPSLRPPLRAI